MVRYLIRRILSGILILFLFVSLMFFLIQIFLPGDFVSHLALGLSREDMAALRARFGLDLPIWQRYLHWLGNLLRGDLGPSYGQGFFSIEGTVTEVLAAAVPPTLLVFGVGTALAFLLGMWLGKSIAWRKRGVITGSTTFGAILLYTAFPPWLSFLLSYVFITRLRLFSRSVDNMFWKNAPLAQNQLIVLMLLQLGVIVAVLLLLSWLLQRLVRRPMPPGLFVLLAGAAWVLSWRLMSWWPYTFDVAKRAVLPLLAFTTLSFGEVMIIMRTTMIDTLHEQYIQTARAKGLRPADIRDRHAARNALLPVLSRLVISLPYLLTGAAMIEMTLNWEGVGTRLFYAVGRQDINTAIGGLLVIGLISLSARLLLDVLVALLDPRVRHGDAREAGARL